MRKAILMVLLVALAGMVYPCIISFEPESVVTEQGKPFEVKVYVKLEHRRCPVKIKETKFEGKNIKILSKGEWVKEKKGLYSVVLKVLSTGENGELRVIRECEKKGISEGLLKIKPKQ